MQAEIASCVRVPERNDMVEYFGVQLDGYAFSQFGWVQSYGSRCVKPPILFGDIPRLKPMTVEWIAYAQSLTQNPMEGMLTGWSRSSTGPSCATTSRVSSLAVSWRWSGPGCE